jgi:hypothetical protein
MDVLDNQSEKPVMTDGLLKANIKPNSCLMCIIKEDKSL